MIDSQNRWGPKTALDVKNFAAGFSTTSFITDAQLEQVWKIITGDAQSEFAVHQDLVLQTADIKTDPGTFKDGNNLNVTGVGVSEAVTLTQRTQ